MHKSLTRRNSIILITMWGVGAAVFFAMHPAQALLPAAAGLAAGLVAGLLQARAIASAPAAFAATATASDVRRQFVASLPGKLSVAVMWAGALVIAWLTWRFSLAFFGATFGAGYLTLMFVRDVVTLPALARIADM
jgi:hypothetical protein